MARILVADDEQQILEAIVDVLENAGHTVVGVSDGREALFQVQSTQFDLVVLDVMMPKMDGYHLAKEIHNLRNPPIIVIATSRNFEGDKQALLAAGAAAFVSKPFSNRDLVDMVATLVENRAQNS